MTKQEFKDKLLQMKIHSMMWVLPVFEFHTTGWKETPTQVMSDLKRRNAMFKNRAYRSEIFTHKKTGKSSYIIYREG